MSGAGHGIGHAVVERLRELGLKAEPAVRAALRANPSLENRKRLEALLEEMRESRCHFRPAQCASCGQWHSWAGWGRRSARKLLDDLAGGVPSAPLTRQAVVLRRSVQ